MKRKMLICTTVPSTLTNILKHQPKSLSKYFDVELVTSSSPNLDVIELDEAVNVHVVNMKRGINFFSDLKSLFEMFLLLRKLKPDIVHSYTPKAGLVMMLSAFICRVPIRIHTFTGLIFPTSLGLKKKILIKMDKLICACATNVVPEGAGIKNDLINYSITRKNLKVIGNGNISGVDTDYFLRSNILIDNFKYDILNGVKLGKKAFVFCFVGRLTREKGLVELFDAFSLLPNNAYLLLVGENDMRLPLSDKVLDKFKDHPRIINIGWQEDIRPALAKSNVLVLPSYREGFPNTPLQAGSMELPCIVSDVNGCNEIIENGVNGWIVPPRDSLSLSAAMLSAMECESQQLHRMGIKARELVENKFKRSDYIKNLVAFYNDLLKKQDDV